MVMSEKARRQFMRDMHEDYADFLVRHGEEAKGNRFAYVDARMIALPGQVMMTMLKMGWVDCNGVGFRPLR